MFLVFGSDRSSISGNLSVCLSLRWKVVFSSHFSSVWAEMSCWLQSQVSLKSVLGQSQVSLRSVLGQSVSVSGHSQVSQSQVSQSQVSPSQVSQSQVSLRSVSGQSHILKYFVLFALKGPSINVIIRTGGRFAAYMHLNAFWISELKNWLCFVSQADIKHIFSRRLWRLSLCLPKALWYIFWSVHLGNIYGSQGSLSNQKRF